MAIDKLEEKLKRDVWWVLQEIKKEYMVTPDNQHTEFAPTKNEAISDEDQRRALRFLVKEKVIEIVRDNFPMNMGIAGRSLGMKPMSYYLRILQPIFNETFKSYENKFDYPEHFSKPALLPPQKNKDDVVLGPLTYKNGGVYYKDSLLGLTPQAVKLCKLFIETPDEFISDDTIQEAITNKSFISTENMQKIVSKLRTTLRKENKKLDIQRVSNKGYIFIAKEIR